MEVKTYRAKSLQQALQLVRRDLGPEAAVLHTREVAGGLLGFLGGRQIEVLAALGVDVPSRFAQQHHSQAESDPARTATGPEGAPSHQDYRAKFRQDLKNQIGEPHSPIEQFALRPEWSAQGALPKSFAALLQVLIDADVHEECARGLLERLQLRTAADDWDDSDLLKAKMARLIEDEITCAGPIQVGAGQRRLVALVGPTGVGKTTTIAKLAAQFHLRERRRVGLITVDTYRIAAVDQLQTYADIIDLPMEVVSTPREMRIALGRLSEMELVLMDTAGRSPSDELKIQELRSLVAEAHADEVQLVLSSVASPSSIRNATEQFAGVGVTSLILTKLDEATGIGGLLSLLRGGRLPLSYVTTGQNVPDDIAAADSRKLARRMLRMEGGQ